MCLYVWKCDLECSFDESWIDIFLKPFKDRLPYLWVSPSVAGFRGAWLGLVRGLRFTERMPPNNYIIPR